MFDLGEGEGTIYAKYFNAIPNWGDQAGVYLTEKITGRSVSRIRFGWREHLVTIGSILSECNSKSIVWGAGFISQSSKLKSMPRRITAVRGPKSLSLLREYGFKDPVALGDPAVLMPRFYCPDVRKKHSIGYIPHYIDRENPEVQQIAKRGINIVDIRLPVEEFVDALLECEYIYSSSLHGLIAADSYGLASKWVQGSELIIGGEFKFQDYYFSIGLFNEAPVALDFLVTGSEEELKKMCCKKELSISGDELLDAFPLKV